MQPFVKDEHGVVRFKKNRIVDFLLDEASAGRKCDLNDLARRSHQLRAFTQDEWCQFYQLIGYSLCGYHELSNVPDDAAKAASAAAKAAFPDLDVGGCRDCGCEIHCGVEREE
jgi:hypothetical protein